MWINNNLDEKGIKSPLTNDIHFRLQGIETLQDSPNIHILDNTYTVFNKKEIIIYYELVDLLKAIEIANIRFLDMYFRADFLTCGDQKLFYKKEIREEDIYSFLIKNFHNNNSIKINSTDEKSIIYSSSVLIYKITCDHEDSYFLNKEFDRWKKITKK